MATISQTLSKAAPPDTQSPLARLKSFWVGLGNTQKIYLGVGAAITLVVAGIFANLIASPDYKTVITGLEAADVQVVSAQLAAKKIPYINEPVNWQIKDYYELHLVQCRLKTSKNKVSKNMAAKQYYHLLNLTRFSYFNKLIV